MRTKGTRRTALGILVAVGVAATSAFASDDAAMTLTVGETRTIPGASLRSYSLSGPGIVQVRIAQGDLLVEAAHAGRTRVLLIHRDGSQHTLDITVR